ncbi:MAG TPA: hypothetical protein VFK69_10730 [Candidatus Eisenbacteria bacterium]|nr:hypothetical protein [Candidatus Eisenbacteria bacterium]
MPRLIKCAALALALLAFATCRNAAAQMVDPPDISPHGCTQVSGESHPAMAAWSSDWWSSLQLRVQLAAVRWGWLRPSQDALVERVPIRLPKAVVRKRR